MKVWFFLSFFRISLDSFHFQAFPSLSFNFELTAISFVSAFQKKPSGNLAQPWNMAQWVISTWIIFDGKLLNHQGLFFHIYIYIIDIYTYIYMFHTFFHFFVFFNQLTFFRVWKCCSTAFFPGLHRDRRLFTGGDRSWCSDKSKSWRVRWNRRCHGEIGAGWWQGSVKQGCFSWKMGI